MPSPDVISSGVFSSEVSSPAFFPRSRIIPNITVIRTVRHTAVLIPRRALTPDVRFSCSESISALLLSVFRAQKKMPPVFRPMTSSSSALFDFITAPRRFASLSARHPASICCRKRGTVACLRPGCPLRRRPQEGCAAGAGNSGADLLPYISDRLSRRLPG